MTPQDRLALVCDDGSFRELRIRAPKDDPLEFPEYRGRLSATRSKTQQKDAIVCGTARIDGLETAVAVMDSRFFMGSMGTAVGHAVCTLTEHAARKKLPLVIFCCSGGARMQEGIFSLMQMASTAAAVERFKNAGGFFLTVLCDPTMGGVSASFAFLGDIIAAEPGALIGFAGPRVITQTIGGTLPEGFQRAEWQLENGMIDLLLPRKRQKEAIARLLRLNRPVKDGAAFFREEE
ncbi:MAG: acetyl-CoA carboxylase carboxyl transferase subunit beta [Firmicutes bacterium]|nr:acetyl-CoA carboxylase carboxyl transferase subunit beta [Bacillota bacterium]